MTFSFYRYVLLKDPRTIRDIFFKEWSEMAVKGRIYISQEGINGQLSVPDEELVSFRASLEQFSQFKNIPWKTAVEEGNSFEKLTIKVRNYIVADGLAPGTYDVSDVGRHLTSEEFNEAIEKGALVVDMRNHYESRIGRFEGALCPDADTFRDALPLVLDMLRGKEDKKVLLYCTGGIRCEKASSYLKNAGFKDVNQLYGGIIAYAHEARERALPVKFKGRNFVFDERLSERITEDIVAECDTCPARCDLYYNCANEICNLLFIQCEKCRVRLNNCCSQDCKKVLDLSPEEYKALRKKQPGKSYELFKSRQRPKALR